MRSYKDLEIYQLALTLCLEVHEMSLKLPAYELYEQGSQIRRSSKSIKDNIAEGYGRRRYKHDFIKYLVYAQGSLLECISQLDTIERIHKVKEIPLLKENYEILGAKIYSFMRYVELHWNG